MLLQLHPDNPEPRKLLQIVECLKGGGTIIYPTDTIYGLGCDIFQQKAIEQICRIKGVKPEKTNFSFICNDLSHITDFTLPLDNTTYKLMKRVLPGAYTFILRANNNVPKLFKNNKKTVGIRIPNSVIIRTLVTELGNPILTTSLKTPEDDVLEYHTDPYEIHEEYERLVDIVIDGGFGGNTPSTVVDCTTDTPLLLREGAGEIVW
jgi:tRNA threonylcarbamoyl adenosine modification protein (Sua5/YciO/YrdC/YwlC family)